MEKDTRLSNISAYGVYVHIPFCQQKCFYCDFPSFAGRERYMADYLQALQQEFKMVLDQLA